MRRPLEAEGLPRGALPGEGFPEGFTFPGALAAARWGLPGLDGTGEGREQRHGPAACPAAPRSGGARWRRGAGPAGTCSSPAPAPKMAAGPLWELSGESLWAGGVVLSSGPLLTGLKEGITVQPAGKSRGWGFHSLSFLATLTFPHSARWE